MYNETSTDQEVNMAVANILGMGHVGNFDPCNVFSHAYPIIKKMDVVMDLNGTAEVPNTSIQYTCTKQLLKATMLCFIASKAILWTNAERPS